MAVSCSVHGLVHKDSKRHRRDERCLNWTLPPKTKPEISASVPLAVHGGTMYSFPDELHEVSILKRQSLATSPSWNVIHGSDSVENARKDITEDLFEWRSSQHNCICEGGCCKHLPKYMPLYFGRALMLSFMYPCSSKWMRETLRCVRDI